MQVKICGLTNIDNMIEVIKLSPDYMGFIFYKGSKRYLGDPIPQFIHNAAIAADIKKVGVFVNSKKEEIEKAIYDYQLDFVQLHGNEPISFCKSIAKIIPVIKVFQPVIGFDFHKLKAYEEVCTYFLFDTLSPMHGGSGISFDWALLDKYKLSTPFFLSGGISLAHIPTIKKLNHPAFLAIDVNSQFETIPGVKNVNLLKQLIDEIHN